MFNYRGMLSLVLSALAVSASAQDDSMGVRLGWLQFPLSQSTDLTVEDQGVVSSYSEQHGTFDRHWRIEPQVVQRWTGSAVGIGLAYGPTYGELQATNRLGTVRHRFFGLGVEPHMVINPGQIMSLELGVSLNSAYAQGEMLLSRNGQPAVRAESKYGVAYDSTLRVRPVWNPKPWLELSIQVSYTMFMEERLRYKQGDVAVLEVDSIHGPGVGGTLGFWF